MLFTFPSRYWFAIGLTGVFSLAGWARRIRAGLHVSRVTQDAARPQLASYTELSSSMVELSRSFYSRLECHGAVLLPRRGTEVQLRFGLVPGRSPLLGESLLFSFPRGTKMFQFPRLASLNLAGMSALQADGLSHSEIRGSRDICSYPRLIAAYHVLRRLREPRHPPCALIYFLACALPKKRKGKLILSAVSVLSFACVLTYSLVCQYVKDLVP